MRPAKVGRPSAPINGSFRMDREGSCNREAAAFQLCEIEHDGRSEMCRAEMRQYMVCRMDLGLMERTSLEKLGLDESSDRAALERAAAEDAVPPPKRREDEGFVAGYRHQRRY